MSVSGEKMQTCEEEGAESEGEDDATGLARKSRYYLDDSKKNLSGVSYQVQYKLH